MRPLTPALEAATLAGTAAPWVRLELIDAVPHYGAVFGGGPVGRNAAALAADGALAQVYHDGVATIYARRVTDPSAASWGAWGAVTAAAAPGAGVALARLSDRLRLLWQAGAGTQLYAADSVDSGASWGAATELFDAGAPLSGIAGDGAAETLFVAYQAGPGAWRVAAWSLSGTWSRADWPNGDCYAVAGLGALRNADGSYLLAVATQAGVSTGAALRVCTYSSGAWSAASTVVPADLGAGVFLAEPKLAFYDGRYHLAYAVVDSGAVSGLPAARTALLHSADGLHWTDPLEDANAYAHGATPLKHAAGYLLAAPDSAALAPLYTAGAAQYRDCSADVSRLEVVQQDGAPARLVVTLQNEAGHYDALPALRLNATLRLWLGYAGAGLAPAYLLYIEDWSDTRAADERELVIVAADCSAWLDRQSRTTLQYSGQTVGWLALEIAARAGLLSVSLPATAQFSYPVPSFAIPAGATWRDALARLGRVYGFDAAARAQPDGTDSFVLMEKNPTDTPVWSYGGEIEQQVTGRSAERANHVLVYGAPAPGAPPVGEAWDWSDVSETGQERHLHVVEPLITTHGGAALRATLELNREARAGRGGAVSAALHPGLEVWDVITLTAGPAPTTLRVATLRHLYEPYPGTYDVVLTCEGP